MGERGRGRGEAKVEGGWREGARRTPEREEPGQAGARVWLSDRVQGSKTEPVSMGSGRVL